jgi:signal transduction histidine kinase
MVQALEVHPEQDSIRFGLLVGVVYKYCFQSPETAIEYANEALVLAKELDDPLKVAKVFQLLGIAYASKRELGQALDYYITAKRIQEEQGAEELVAENLSNISGVYFYREEYETAYDYALESLNIVEKHHDELKIANCNQGIALILEKMGKYDQAFTHYQKALRRYRAEKEVEREAQTLYNMALLMEVKKLHSEGIEFLKRALILYREKDQPLGVLIVLNAMGSNYLDQGKYEEATRYLKEALPLAEKRNFPSHLQNTYLYLARLDSSQGRYREAILNFSRSDYIQDSLFQAQYDSRLEEIKIEFETEEKEKSLESLNEKARLDHEEISRQQWVITKQRMLVAFILLLLLGFAWAMWILYKANRKQKLAQIKIETQKTELEQLNDTKDQWFSVISHDFRSPLTFLQSALTLINGGKLNSAETRMLTIELEARVKRTASLLDNLLYWAQSQLQGITPRPRTLNLHSIAQENFAFFQPQAQKKSIRMRMEVPTPLPIWADRDMVQLAVRNLISNALKFTYPDGNIWISATIEGEQVYFSVHDDGCGIPADKLDHLFQLYDPYAREGTAYEKGTGLGLWLVKKFIELNQGSIQVESTLEQGSTFTLVFPTREM